VSDYGHELAFGAFVTPSSAHPEAVVELARLADRAGLDLVTFQDHPYQPAFLDTWTLMSYVAARTTRVRLAGNVLSLPLRNPVVLARSVASLDLLSGGRVELGIGAGAFWAGIEAMGGRRLASGQAVDALAEAIQIVRQLWDTTDSEPVRVPGTHHRAVGARRGPAPAHPVSIWVGAYKPRMLRLIGRLADGWLPTLDYLQPGDLAAGNARIDEAASAAGRHPGDIRRLLNIGGRFAPGGTGLLDGPPEMWAEQLAGLALTEGISTFILASDDPDDIRAYAAEVAPAVRELVAAARAAGTGPAAGRADSPAPELAYSPAPEPADSPAQEPADSPAQEPAEAPAADKPGVEPTPDDGTRLSSTRLWDEATRPTRPAAPAGRGYTPAGRAASGQLVQVHDMLRRELAAVRDLITQVQKGAIDAGQARSELSQMTMRQNNWTLGAYCESYCRVVTQHHSIEDAAVFPYLRTAEPGLGPVLDRLSEEHGRIHQVIESVDRALVRYITHPDDLTELQDLTDLLTDTLLSHLAYEERELIEPLARYGFYNQQIW
jgi:alkanesulfonate monooxygenase SsuD/methylene tetrahydromethanopterin reductase-like flavin-dependent oxidoreductase (luciferase family)/hemerythrin-like domain-containing protein